MKELQKYIDVDVFGKCGQLKCSKDKKCHEMIAKNYKFYLAFENSVSFLIILLLKIFSSLLFASFIKDFNVFLESFVQNSNEIKGHLGFE